MPADCLQHRLFYDIQICALTLYGTERYDDMNQIKPLSFILPNGLAAVSAAFHNEKIVAVDGTTCDIFIFNLDGSPCDKQESLHPLRKIHYDFRNCRYLALSGNSNDRVFFLNCSLEEVGSIFLDVDTDDEEDEEDTDELMDASPDSRNNESVIIATHRYSVRAYAVNGEEIGFVRPIDDTRLKQNFVYSGQTEAFNYIRNDVSFVSIRNGTQNFTGAVPAEFSLRTLIADGEGNVYGLFGYQYIYNYILPIYLNGEYVLSAADNVGNIVDNISRCC